MGRGIGVVSTRSRARDRSGVSIIELLVAVTLLATVIVGLAASSLYASRLVTRSRVRLEATEFLQAELERLSALPYDSLASGSRSVAEGSATWTVLDSVRYRRIVLITNYSPRSGTSEWDTVVAYRLRP